MLDFYGDDLPTDNCTYMITIAGDFPGWREVLSTNDKKTIEAIIRLILKHQKRLHEEERVENQ